MEIPYPNYLNNYLPILIFIGFAIIMATLITILPFIIASKKPDKHKNAAYECGFDPFGDARSRFDIRFYLVAILFIVFDLEIMFLFPWAISLSLIGKYGFWMMMIFLAILTVGFIYEWRRGALEWE